MELMEDIKPIIRKITIGDMKEGLTYVVGQTMMRGQLEVTAIVQDEAAWYKHQQVVYDVTLKKEKNTQSHGKIFLNQLNEFDIQDKTNIIYCLKLIKDKFLVKLEKLVEDTVKVNGVEMYLDSSYDL